MVGMVLLLSFVYSSFIVRYSFVHLRGYGGGMWLGCGVGC